MDAARHSNPDPLSRFEQLRFAREIVRTEGEALVALAERLEDAICVAADLLLRCSGNVIITGIGKAGLIGQKICATFSSTGTPSHFMHPGEAVHGDLGRVRSHDVVLAFSYSGESEELIRLLPALRGTGSSIIAVTGNPSSTLAKFATVVLNLGSLREACPHGLAPTTSTAAMLAIGDALGLLVSRMRNFGPTDFARFHPGGSLGRKLTHVDQVMRPLKDCRVAVETQTIREVLVLASKPGRRSGAIMLLNESNQLAGVFTDSDLARLLEARREDALDQPMRNVMTRSPMTVASGSMMSVAVALMVERKISELPVVDVEQKPIGLIDITDVVAWLPANSRSESEESSLSTANSTQIAGANLPDLPRTVPFTSASSKHFPRQSRR